jgi:hypothetical protein
MACMCAFAFHRPCNANALSPTGLHWDADATFADGQPQKQEFTTANCITTVAERPCMINTCQVDSQLDSPACPSLPLADQDSARRCSKLLMLRLISLRMYCLQHWQQSFCVADVRVIYGRCFCRMVGQCTWVSAYPGVKAWPEAYFQRHWAAVSISGCSHSHSRSR